MKLSASVWVAIVFFGSPLAFAHGSGEGNLDRPSAEEVFKGLRTFYKKTARPDGSFSPGVDPDYLGMSDCAYSDLAAVTYACTVHKTFAWTLPYEKETIEFLQSRQRKDGSFFNVKGTVDSNSPQAQTYNTTQGLVALRALGAKPRYNALQVFDQILKADYKTLPPYSTSFFPLAYLCAGKPIPKAADRRIRELMVQDRSGYLNDHVAATFHASHYYRLVGEETPKSKEMVARLLRDQKADGSWMLHMPSRDRHATFDAVFTLVHEGSGREDCRAAIERAANWSLSCRNRDGGFGHFPGSTSDADAIYFQVGVLVMAGFLKPAEPLPTDPHLLSWGHLMPPPTVRRGAAVLSLQMDGWVGSVATNHDGHQIATATSDNAAHIIDMVSGKKRLRFRGHKDSVVSVQFSPHGKLLATGSYDRTARIWDTQTGKPIHELGDHRGAVLSVAFSPDGRMLATGSIDQTLKLWDIASGRLQATLTGHKSWVNSVVFSPDGTQIVSGSSDGTIKIWSTSSGKLEKTVRVTNAEIRSIAFSPDGKYFAAGVRYGMIKVWDAATWVERLSFQGHRGDVWSVAFSANGEVLASGNGDWNRGGVVKLWNVETGNQLGQYQHTGEVLCIAFSRGGKSLVAGSADNTVKVWNLSP